MNMLMSDDTTSASQLYIVVNEIGTDAKMQ